MNLVRVDGIAHIMTRAIGNGCNQVHGLAEGPANDLYDIDVKHLVMTADIVTLAHAAIMNDQINGLAMILHIKPVANILTLAIYTGRGLSFRALASIRGIYFSGK